MKSGRMTGSQIHGHRYLNSQAMPRYDAFYSPGDNMIAGGIDRLGKILPDAWLYTASTYT